MTLPLISTERLAEERRAWTILDASVEKTSGFGEAKAYRSASDAFLQQGHIPSARFADLLDRFSDPDGSYPFARPKADRFQAAARELGVSNRDRIAVYDRTNGIWAARVWWLFRAFGHDEVAVLDGGFLRWASEGRPVTDTTEPIGAGDFQARQRPHHFVDKDTVAEIVAGRSKAQLINVLRGPVYVGREQTYARPGHIPGSSNVPYADLIDPMTNTLLPRDDLETRFAGVLADPAPIVTYCGGGITAAGSALVLAALGRTDVAVYDGSLNEWADDPAMPLVVEA